VTFPAPALLVPLLLGAPADPELTALRESAREALRGTCGRCHDGARPTARPAALRVFDLRNEDWLAGVTDVQMDHMVDRFEAFHLPERDRRTVGSYLDAERARRAATAAAAASAVAPER